MKNVSSGLLSDILEQTKLNNIICKQIVDLFEL